VEDLLKILTLIFISSVKFAFGPSYAYMNENYDFTWFQTNLYAILGGMIGVTFFIFLSDWIMRLWDKLRTYYFRRKHRREMFSTPMADTTEAVEIHYQYIEKPIPQRKIFNKRNRRMVRLWKKYGLVGLAALTPLIFSIPIGTFFMSRLERNRKKILLYMFVSITCWSLLITTFFQLTNFKSFQEIFR
jgi:hypothetical protein